MLHRKFCIEEEDTNFKVTDSAHMIPDELNENSTKFVELEIKSVEEQRFDLLATLFPEVIQDGAVNVGVLKDLLGHERIIGDIGQPNTKYGLYWYDKNQARQIANASTRSTLRPEENKSVDFVKTKNLILEGDNLEVLKLLQRSYIGKVDMIYIDPPYNTGNDFVYKDTFGDPINSYLRQTGQIDEEGKKFTSDFELSGRHHAPWLSMMYARLKVARALLSSTGIIFISINDEELYQLKIICDEIFGEENFIENFIWANTTTPPSLAGKSRSNVEYILCYQKTDTEKIKFFGRESDGDDAPLSNISNRIQTITIPAQTCRFPSLEQGTVVEGIKPSGAVLLDNIVVEENVNLHAFRVAFQSKWGQPNLIEEIKQGTYFLVKNSNYFSIRYQKKETAFKAPDKYLDRTKFDVETNEFGKKELDLLFPELKKSVFDYPKNTPLLKTLMNMVFYDKKTGIVLDFFAGSGSTGHAVVDFNKAHNAQLQYILVQIPEDIRDGKDKSMQVQLNNDVVLKTLSDVTRERMNRVGRKNCEKNLDLGYKFFSLKRSNYRLNSISEKENFSKTNEEIWSQWNQEIENPLIEQSTPESVLYENMLREGYSLDIEIKKVLDTEIRFAEENTKNGFSRILLCSLDKVTDNDLVNLEQVVFNKDYNSVTFICLDTNLTDTQKFNLNKILKLKSV